MSVYQLVYFSRSVSDGDRAMLARLRSILSVSRRNNQRLGITGYLIIDRKSFMQVLEGERKAVNTLFKHIQTDSRHTGVTIIEARDVETRSFGNWAMGATLRTPDREGVFVSHGLDDGFDPTRLKAARLIALAQDLAAFDQGERNKVRISA